MNVAGKPKPAKLWKNSPKSDKKQKSSKQRMKFTNESATNSPNQKEKFTNDSETKSPFKKVNNKAQNEHTISPKQNMKRKQSFNSTPNKKNKSTKNNESENFTEETEMQVDYAEHDTSVNNEIPENFNDSDATVIHSKEKPNKSVVLHAEAMYKKRGWRELHKKQKGKTDMFELGKVLKTLWEELRRKDCKPERKSELLKQVCGHLKGHVKEFSYAHDTVRVLESVLILGAETHRTLLFEELKDEIIPLSKSKYGKFFILKMLKYGSKNQKDAIIKTFYGKVIKLMKHSQSASVVEMAFNECTNATQRFELIQEFFGPSFKFFKVTDVHTLGELIASNPEKKSTIIQNMKEELMKVLEKSVVKHSIVHHVLWQYMKHSDGAARSDIIESLRDVVPEILHTKDGSRVGMHCIWFGTKKDRKAILKSMKQFAAKIAVEEFGHMVLLAAFDVIDDTSLIEKLIVKELLTNMLEISQNVHGKKVLIYLLSPRDPHFFHPDVINILKTGDDNKTSKKDPELRRSELKAIIAEPLLQLIKSNIKELYTDNAFCLFTCTILDHTVGNRREAFESVAELLNEPYTVEEKNTHPIEHPGSSFMFKQLITQDQKTPDADCYFSEVLANKVPESVMASWIECNRGAFLLVNLIETNIPSVIKRVKEELEGRKKLLAKKNYRGAEILLKKLKETCK